MDLMIRQLHDELGPAAIAILHDHEAGLDAIVVVDNIACGPAIGGVRIAPDVDVTEVVRLARAMTFKNAAAGLPHGGGKAGIVADPTCAVAEKEDLLRAFARAIRTMTDYIPGPDMGTDEMCMAWVKDEIGRAVGLPRVMGGIPLDEIGATGFGLAVAADVAAPAVGLELDEARVVIQGFGAVGMHAARYLVDRGARIIAVADSRGALYDPAGLNMGALIAHKRTTGTVVTYPHGQRLPGAALVGIDCDIWIPAARPDVLNDENVHQLSTRMVLPGANIPATPAAEAWMHEHGVLYIPDFIANAGGVICASVEYHGGTELQAFEIIEEAIRRNVRDVLCFAMDESVSTVEAAQIIARQRVKEAMSYRVHT
jgi:glutamate dehydrogenase/leucine dehydrogenase